MSFVGREMDLQQIGEWLAEGARVVTLVGPGGVGKTTLGQRFSDSPELDGVERIFCELAEVSSISRLCEEIARAAKIQGIGNAPDPIAALGARIAKLGRVLFVLDNCEQATRDIASALARWVDAAPNAFWIATSRHVLGLANERVLHVAPLSRTDAVALFVERAGVARQRYVPTERDAKTIGAIVERLDGLPLAIELAAARMAIVSADDLLHRLETGLEALVSERSDVPSRQRTMRALIAWSWSLLEPWERAALEQCAVFRGGFTVRAAEKIVDLSAHANAPPLLDVIQALNRKSLLRAYAPTEAPDEMRLALYETVREYVLECAPRDRNALETRHAAVMIEAASRALAALDGRDAELRAAALGTLSLEHDNLLRALASTKTDHEAMRAMLALTPILRRRASARTELELLDATLDRAQASNDVLRGWLLAGRSRLMMMMSRFEDADANLREARAIARMSDDRLLEGRALIGLFSSAEATERTEDAATFIREAVAALEHTRSRWRAVALGGLAMTRSEDALAHFDAALALWSRDCDSGYEGTAHYRPATHAEHALLLMELGRGEDAAGQLRRAFDSARDLGPRTHTLLTYYRAGYLHWNGDWDASIAAYRSAAASGEGGTLYQPLILGGLAAALASVGDVAAAGESFERAESIVALEVGRVVLSVQRGHLDLARGDVAAARARLERTRSLTRATSDVRLASMTLRAALERSSARTLEVSRDATHFKLDGRDATVAQRLIQKLFRELVDARLKTPGRALAVDDVCRAVWPGERILPRAARRRVQVAISTLRSHGLRDVLQTNHDGYLLDPDVPLTITA